MSGDRKDIDARMARLRAQKCRLGMRQPQKKKTIFPRNCPNLKRPALVAALMLLGSLCAAWRVAAAPPVGGVVSGAGPGAGPVVKVQGYLAANELAGSSWSWTPW